jgi:hypothetical protein
LDDCADTEQQGEYCSPITDSKEPDGQGQRRKTGFLWIREAGIALYGEYGEKQGREEGSGMGAGLKNEPWAHRFGYPGAPE